VDVPPRTGSATDQPRCSHCGDVIGVYEPYVVTAVQAPSEPSRGQGPPAAIEGLHLYHERCYKESRAVAGA